MLIIPNVHGGRQRMMVHHAWQPGFAPTRLPAFAPGVPPPVVPAMISNPVSS